MKNNYSKISFLVVGLLLINFLSSKVYQRFDLTEDGRYTISETSKKIIENIHEVVSIKVYLEGDFPAEFKRLQTETRLHLEELKALNKKIQFRFINPSEIGQELIDKGMQPSSLQVQENGKLSEIVLFPFAEVSYKNKPNKFLCLKIFFQIPKMNN